MQSNYLQEEKIAVLTKNKRIKKDQNKSKNPTTNNQQPTETKKKLRAEERNVSSLALWRETDSPVFPS